jgi:DNA-directed RNA polymerase specialized sigma24 family protein
MRHPSRPTREPSAHWSPLSLLTWPARERIAIVLRFWQHAPEAEIAEVLGCTERIVRNLLRRAYARLRASYAKDEAIP